MPAVEHLQSSFTGGELSPRLLGRTDSDLYRRGLATCRNWEVVPQGGLRRAPGTTLLATGAGISQAVRALPLRSQAGQDFYVALSGGASPSLSIFDASGVIQAQAILSQYIINGQFNEGTGGLQGWTLTGAVATTAIGGAMAAYLPPSGAVAQAMTVPAGTYDLLFQSFGQLPDGSTLTVSVGTTLGGNDLLNVVVNAYSTVTFSSNSVTCPAGTVYLKIANKSGTYVAYLENVSFGLSGTSTAVAVPWTEGQLGAVQFVSQSGKDAMYFFHPNVAPQQLYRPPGGQWTFAPITFISIPLVNPAIPSSGPAWAGVNWPAVAELWQGRLYLAGLPGQPNRIWGSRPGVVNDFTLEDTVSGTLTVTAGNAIDESLSTKGAVRWMRGRYMLLVGTDLGEGAITSGSGLGGAVSPLDFQFYPQSSFGAAAIQVEDVGDEVLYVSADQRKVRAMSYQLTDQAWITHDISFQAEHITEPLIKEIHFARDPNSTIVALLADGSLACCTYDRAEQIQGWWTRVTQPPDQILSLAVLNGPTGSILFMLVSRGGSVLLESMPMSEFAPGRVSLDSAVSVNIAGLVGSRDANGVPNGAAVGGFGTLLGRTVTMIIDGAIEPESQVVSAGGTVILGDAGTTLVVGLGFTSRAITLCPEHALPLSTIQRGRKRWAKLFARLNDSALPLVNGRRPAADRTPSTSMGVAEPLYTGDAGPSSGDVEDGGQVTIEQDLPLRTEILSIFGSFEVNAV